MKFYIAYRTHSRLLSRDQHLKQATVNDEELSTYSKQKEKCFSINLLWEFEITVGMQLFQGCQAHDSIQFCRNIKIFVW